MISRPNSILSLAVILLAALSASRSLSPPAQAAEKIRIGIPVVAMSQLPILIAQQNKLFQAEGFGCALGY